jgi:flavin-dependent dehydrogenase
MEHDTQYDVIIVGGRVAGSTLAGYLGKAGLRVLLLERAVFPEPHPASSPMMQPVTMAMLDEIGADENEYARNTPPIHRFFGVDFGMELMMEIPEIGGRNYAYAVERARFDHALWDNALRYDTVDGIMGFSVTNLLWDNIGKTVIGVEGKHRDSSDKQRFMSKVVVGADGRFSLVARKVEAAERNREDEHPTTIYYGYWANVKPHDDGDHTAVAYGSKDGSYGYLVMESADDTTCIAIEGRSDVVSADGNAEAYYIDILKENPAVWARVQDAQLKTKVHGMKKVGNLFREPGGLGWALVGDAYHQKDPIDGQGIYDAVFSSRAMAAALVKWQNGESTWDEALQTYDDVVRAEMLPQYETTLNRVQQQMYPAQTQLPIPRRLLATPLRWLYKDRVMKEAAGLALNRQIDPRIVAKPQFIAMAMLRGSLRELSERLD